VILGIGCDIIEHRSVQKELARSSWANNDGIFTAPEIARCSSRTSVVRFAACFAAKEATLKALGLDVGDLEMFREVELGADRDGEHPLLLHGRAKERSEQLGVRRVSMTIATSSKLTSAMVVLES